MTQQEFIEKVDEMFKEFEIEIKFSDDLNSRWLNTNKNISITFSFQDFGIYKIEDTQEICIYESSQYDDLETHIDELIIFKELILPKYL